MFAKKNRKRVLIASSSEDEEQYFPTEVCSSSKWSLDGEKNTLSIYQVLISNPKRKIKIFLMHHQNCKHVVNE